MSTAERIAAFTEILKVLVWPAIVAWLAWYLRAEVKRAAERIIELGFTGAKFAPPAQQVPVSPQNAVSEAVGPAKGIEDAKAMSPSDSSSVALFIAQINSIISQDQLELVVQAMRQGILPRFNSPQDQIEALLYMAASLSVQLTHERSYDMIFGSQLRLLELMIPESGASSAMAHEAYNAAKTAYPDIYRPIGFEQWIGFLLNAGLCTVRAENGNYVLTPFGRGFLKYILDRRLPPQKPF